MFKQIKLYNFKMQIINGKIILQNNKMKSKF